MADSDSADSVPAQADDSCWAPWIGKQAGDLDWHCGVRRAVPAVVVVASVVAAVLVVADFSADDSALRPEVQL